MDIVQSTNPELYCIILCSIRLAISLYLYVIVHSMWTWAQYIVHGQRMSARAIGCLIQSRPCSMKHAVGSSRPLCSTMCYGQPRKCQLLGACVGPQFMENHWVSHLKWAMAFIADRNNCLGASANKRQWLASLCTPCQLRRESRTKGMAGAAQNVA